MPNNSSIIITDTSCLILLNKIGELELLKSLSSHVYITPIIRDEFKNNLPSWITVKEPKDKHYQNIIEQELDKGEASAISLSLEIDNSILIIDDMKGRKFAEGMKLRYSGTFGLLLRAKQVGVIKEIKPILEKIRNTNFRFNEGLFKVILEQSGE